MIPSPCCKTRRRLRGRLVLAVLAAVAGHEKDLTAAHIRAVLTLDRGQLSMPYGVTVLREPAALRFFKAASAPAVQAVTVGEIVTFGQWQVSLAESAGEGVLISISETADLTVTAWDSKDRLNGRTVKRLCGERGISPQEAGPAFGPAGERHRGGGAGAAYSGKFRTGPI